MLPFARFQSSRTADADTLARAFHDAGFAPARGRSRARRAYSADGVHAGRPVRVEGSWSAGRTTDVPVLTVTLQARLSGGRFRCHQTIPRDSPLPVPGDPMLLADGAPRSGLTAALAGKLGQDMVAVAAASQNFSNLRAQDDTVVLELSGWPPTGRELTAAVELCATLADVLAAVAPGSEAESVAWEDAERRRLRNSRRAALAIVTVACAPFIALAALLGPI